MFTRLKAFFSEMLGDGGRQELADQDILAEFKKRYHNFRLLLTANKKTLAIMSEMEQAMRGQFVFGMSFVRSQATAASVNVFRIVKHLSEIAPGKYDALFERLKDIQAQIAAVLARQPQTTATEILLPLERVGRDMSDQVGSKMANLGDIMNRLSLPVPASQVIYANFQYVSGVAASPGGAALSVDRLKILDTLISRLSSMKSEPLAAKEAPADLSADRIDALIQQYSAELHARSVAPAAPYAASSGIQPGMLFSLAA